MRYVGKWYRASNSVNLEVTDALIFRGSRSGRYAVHRSSVVVVSKHHKSMYAIRSESGLEKKFGSPALEVSDSKRLRKCQIAN
jgi:hypothetical protein